MSEQRHVDHPPPPEAADDEITLSVVIPAYEEGRRIAETLRVTVAELARLGCRYEILVVDDGSRDDTFERAEALAAQGPAAPDGEIRVVRYNANGGKGYALKFGAARTRGEFVAFLDADLDLHPRLLARMLAVQRECGADIVIGSKRHPDSVIDYPAERRLYSSLYYYLIRLLFGLPVRDTQTGIKLLRGTFARQVLPFLHVNRFAFDLEMLAVAHHLGLRIAEAPIELSFQRRNGRIGAGDIRRICWDTAVIWCRLHFTSATRPRDLPTPVPIAGPATTGLPKDE